MTVYNGTSAADVFYGDGLSLGGPIIPDDDTMYGYAGNDVLVGLLGSDTLYGGDGSDSLRSGDSDSLTDRLFGGKGDDTYWVRELDVVTELANEGRDVVELWYGFQGTYTMPANVEDLFFRDGAGGIGNALDNTITVASGATRVRRLDGRDGNDLISGGNAGETILGGFGNDRLNGGGGDDILNGGAGNDSLRGESGNDRFVFSTNSVFSTSSIGIDWIPDFTVGSDKIVLDKTTFAALKSGSGRGFSIASDFATVLTDAAATTSGAAIVYNSASRLLFYNQNGSEQGFGSGGQFATLLGSPLTAGDFIIQA